MAFILFNNSKIIKYIIVPIIKMPNETNRLNLQLEILKSAVLKIP